MIPSPALLAVALLASPAWAAPDSLAVPDPFSDFETHHLSNGLKVWYRRLPGDPIVSISVALPIGSDRDPPGKEQLAHFTEHMLFSDQPGLSEEEIRREIEELGGVYNASVTSDRTFYYVRIGARHVRFAIEWLGRVLAPHVMSPEVVARQRGPVALEVGARPRQLLDWLWAHYIYPPGLRTPGFWEREFGIETRAGRDYYPYASLHSIRSADLISFYDTYYVPSLMTVTVIGDVEREEALGAVEKAFGSLAPRPEPEPLYSLHDPDRYRQVILWAYRSNVFFSDRYKFYGPSASDEVMLIFVSQLLRKRLNDRLRFGERKAAYGVSVGIVKRGPAAYLAIRGGIKRNEFEFAHSVVEEELEHLRKGDLPSVQFEEDRGAIVRQLAATNTTAVSLERWVSQYFYDPRSQRDFPDLVSAFAGFTVDDVARFAGEHLVPEHEVLTIIHPNPITQSVLILIVALLVAVSVSATRRRLLRRVDMTRIRYIAHFKIPRLFVLLVSLILLSLAAVAVRLLAYVVQLAIDGFLVTLDSFALQWSAYALLLVGAVVLLLLSLSRIPRKLLVFDDRVLIKYAAYRSVAVPLREIEEVSARRFSDVWLSRRIRKCVPLALGALGPAIYLRRRRGWSYFFRVRDIAESLDTLRRILDQASGGASADLDARQGGAPV